ncbi:MAG TPA: N-acetyltransferase DgcN [Thermoanaerobaculia bacterium]|nr:N-acetyltransferase DgcN [Thermoanaerobaculia bacterium]
MKIQTPYLLFLGDEPSSTLAKTARGLAHWRPELCLAQCRVDGKGTDLGLRELTPAAAAAQGAKTMVIGVANVGGYIPESWTASIVAALEAGLDVVSGLHTRLIELEAVREAASRTGRGLHDVRHPGRSFPPGTGEPRPGLRLLTVGTDCAVGKMYTALALERAMKTRGMKADFRATGQTGILIAGEGVSVDAVVSDFVSGAAEWLSPANDPEHWDLIEGQGSLFHPAYAGVTLGLVHGSQPDALVVCHQAKRRHLHGFPRFATPSIRECMERHIDAARLTNSKVICAGISIDTSSMEEDAAAEYLDELEDMLGVPCVDPIKTGVQLIVERLEDL